MTYRIKRHKKLENTYTWKSFKKKSTTIKLSKTNQHLPKHIDKNQANQASRETERERENEWATEKMHYPESRSNNGRLCCARYPAKNTQQNVLYLFNCVGNNRTSGLQYKYTHHLRKKAKQRQQNNSSEQTLQDAVFSFNPNLGLHSLDPASPFPVLAQKKIPINSQQ